MLSFECKGRINVVEAKGDYIGVGCSDGWIYLFEGSKLLWEKKLISTYYRDPYTDVNVISIDIGKDFLAVGTDFMDGKAYLFSLNGENLWYKQFLTIVGCWERPDDVVAVKIGKDEIAIGAEWMNSYVHKLNFKGDEVETFKVDGYINEISFWKDCFIIGTTKSLYFEKKRKINLNINRIYPIKNKLIISSNDGIYTINGKAEKICEAKDPILGVSQKILACYDKKLLIFSTKGDFLWSCEVEKPLTLFCLEEKVYLGYDGYIKIAENGEIIEKFEIIGIPVKLMENYLISVKDRRIQIYSFPEIP